MPNPFDEFGSDKIVTRKLIEYFEKVLDEVTFFKLQKDMLRDCAVICAFLQSNKVFEDFYRQHVDPLLAECYFVEKGKTVPATDRSKGGGLMRAFYELMKGHGFNTLHGVVFTGNAGGFVGVVTNGILFRDMTGPMHGEFTHSLQWLAVCLLQETSCGVIEGGHVFNRPIVDIYKKIVTVQVLWVREDVFKIRHENWPGELSFKDQTAQNAAPKTLWDFMVDAFSATHHTTKSRMAEEMPLENLYTDSYRCPANITVALQWGALQDTFIGRLWRTRTTGYQSRMKEGQSWYHPNRYRVLAVAKQQAKNRNLAAGNTWVDPHSTVPAYQAPPVPPPRQVSLNKIDRFSPPDVWDDEDY